MLFTEINPDMIMSALEKLISGREAKLRGQM